MELSDKLKKELKEQSLKESTKECCGLFVENKGIKYIPLANKSNDEEGSFAIDYVQLQEAEKAGKIIGIFHSHLEGDFSVVDKHIAEKRNLVSVIYKIKEDEFEIYKPIGLEIPYCGRTFVLGVFDCFTLIQDYYARELNIIIPDSKHKNRYRLDLEDDEMNCPDCMDSLNHFLNNGFQKVSTPKKHDVLCNRYGGMKFPTHGLIYLGGNKVLHQSILRPSCIEDYSEQFKKLTMYVVRHESNI